jgi:AsmA-like C-terminal region
MSSRVLTSATTPPADPGKTTHKTSRPSYRGNTILIIIAAVVLIAAGVAGVLWDRFWPFTEKAVVEDLAEASDSAVTIRGSHRTYFPFPGCILEGVEFHHGPSKWTLITIDKLTIEGSYSGILTNRVPRIRAEGGHVFVPPFGSNVTFKTQHSKLVVEELVANGAVVEFASNDPSKKPLRFEMQQGVLHNVQWGDPIDYDLKFHNPEPPGEIATHGKFGVWIKGNPGETPISGEYTFEHADLGVYEGIAGMLSSKGKYGGLLKHIDITGTTGVPDFEVKSGGHKVKLVTQYAAYVDAIRGDTFLKQVDARFRGTDIAVEGSVASVKGRKGKTALLGLTSPQGRIEDILGLFVSEPRAPMSGPITLKAKAEIPPGKERFLEKVKLEGAFGIDDGTFSKAETQKDVNELSAGARGEKMEDAETVLTDLKGQVVLEKGIARFSNLTFGIPGAKARMQGTYNLLNHKIDLHGRMRVDTKISKTETGVKSLLLKFMDPIFKKKKKGEVVPIHIAGTYEHPQFGLDLTEQKDQGHAGK